MKLGGCLIYYGVLRGTSECRAYWQIYPETIAFYIMEYRKEYDRESLIGTEYEYLLHEDEIDEKIDFELFRTI